MDDKDKVIEAFRNSDDPLNAKKVSEISGVDKKEVDKIMKELKKVKLPHPIEDVDL